MKKLLLTLLLSAFVSAGAFSQTQTVGVIGGYPSANATYSIDKIEFELGYSFTSINSLYLSADYTFIGGKFDLGSTSGFFWNFGAGPYVNISSSFGVGVVAPAEVGWNIPELLDNRIDIYLQFAPGVSILPGIDFAYKGGFGIRYRL